jgi:hypothetical protein
MAQRAVVMVLVAIYEQDSGLSYRDHRGASAPTAYASRMMLPPSLHGWLPAARLGRESNPLDHDERFPSCYISSPLPGFTLMLPVTGTLHSKRPMHRSKFHRHSPAACCSSTAAGSQYKIVTWARS